MIGINFIAHSGTDHEWFVIKPHEMFSDTWYCYPIKKYDKDKELKETLIQCFSTDFINKNKIE
jgi:hypothetical protein